MKKLLLIIFYLTPHVLFGQVNTMTFNGTSTTEAGVEFTFSLGSFVNSSDGTEMSLYDNHPWATPINGGGDYKDINIDQSIYITSVNVSWAVNVQDFKLQFLDGETVVKELSSLTTGDQTVNAMVNKIRFFDDGSSSSGGFELANVKWDSALPVELTSFDATYSDNGVLLQWRTETEVSNYGFDIERMKPTATLNQEWQAVGFVEGSGNSNSPKDYSFVDENVTVRKYSYRLKQLDTDGKFEYSKTIEIDLSKPMNYELSQNYPNPFNPSTTIRFSVLESSFFNLSIFNSIGEKIEELINEVKEPGVHTIEFNASRLPSGNYFYKLQADDFVETKKMLLMK